MKMIINLFIALGLLFLVEFIMMLLYNLIVEGNITIETLFGKIFFVSLAVLFTGGFLFMIIKAQVQYMKQGKNKLK